MVMMSAVFYACSSDDPQAPKSEDDDNSEIIDQTIIERAHEQLDYIADLTSTYSDDADKLIENIRHQDFISSVSVDETIVKAITKDGFSIEIDLVPAPCEQPETESDNNRQEQLVSTILSHFDLDGESDEDKTIVIDDDDEVNLNSTSRAGYTPSLKYMTNRSILVFSPDTAFRKYDWDRVINAVKMAKSSVGAFTINQHAIKSYKPEYFKQFSNFGIVVVGCHGTPEGKLLFPFDSMTENLKNIYTEKAQDTEQTGVSFAVKKYTTKDGREVKVRKGVYLGEKFFNEYMGDLSRTIVWTAKCYSGRTLAQFRESCVVKKKAVEYYGATAPCTGKEVFDIFDVWFAGVSHGMDLWNAFKEAPEAPKLQKLLNSGGLYEWNTASKAKYPKPQATGVKNQTSRSGNTAEPVTVGVRFRYAVDENGKPADNTSAGVELTNLDDNSIAMIPMTAENSKLCNSHPVNGTFVISDYDMTLTELNDKGHYRYRTYLKNGDEMFFSVESFDFTAQNSMVLEIYTESDFHSFRHSLIENDYAGKTVVLKKDISVSLKEYENLYYGRQFNGAFDGNDKTINITQYTGNTYLIEEIGKNGVVKNVAIRNQSNPGPISIICKNVGTIDGLKYTYDVSDETYSTAWWPYLIGDNYGTIQNCLIDGAQNYRESFVSGNYGTIKDSEFKTVTSDLYEHTIGSNYGTIQNIHVIRDYSMPFIQSNHGQVINSTFDGTVTHMSRGIAVGDNHEDATVSNCIFNIEAAKTDGGGIEVCAIDCNYGITQDIQIYGNNLSVALKNMPTGKIIGCENHADIEGENTVIWGICYSNGGLISNCRNYGNLSAPYAHGICRGAVDVSPGIISDCANYGDILAVDDPWGYASGICGDSPQMKIVNCTNEGKISCRNNKPSHTVVLAQISYHHPAGAPPIEVLGENNSLNGRCIVYNPDGSIYMSSKNMLQYAFYYWVWCDGINKPYLD